MYNFEKLEKLKCTSIKVGKMKNEHFISYSSIVSSYKCLLFI